MTDGLLFLGANGRVGPLLRRPSTLALIPAATEVTWQSRRWSARPPGMRALTWQPGHPWPAPARGGVPPDVIVALWGVTGGTEAQLELNSVLAEAALDLARTTGARRVLHMSSAAVYSGAFGIAASEQITPQPATAYGRAKLRMEDAIAAWHARHPGGPGSVILRLANVAGADMLFRNMRRPGAITLDRFSDGTGPQRSYIAPQDLMRVIVGLASCPADRLPPVINVAGPAPVAMDQILGAAGWPLRWRRAPDNALPRLALDTSLLQTLIGPLPDSADPRALAAQGLGQPPAGLAS